MDKIGKYDIVRQIGEGGFGVVYEGLDPFLKRRVAIKTCTSEAKELRERFYREAEIAGKLQHRHIVTVHDFGVHEEVPYLVQEFLSGHDLDTMIARRTVLSSDRRLEILLDVAKGLEHAHTKGVIHRDIKPGNIRVVDDGSAKILDFGIAKLANVASHLTRTGMTVGTAAYLPPEQIRGAEVDHRADIFSFGVTAYELLSGERPYTGNTISKLFYQLLNEAPTPMRELWPECPQDLSDVVERCLSKDPAERFGSFGEIIRSLNRVQTAMRRESEKMSGGTTNILTTGKRGLTSLGQALVDDEDVASGQYPTEIEIEAEEPTEPVDPGTRVVTWARQLLSEGDPAAAQEALRLFLSETPKHAEASALLAEVSKALNDERLASLTSEVESTLAAGETAKARGLLADAGREGFTHDQLASLAKRVETVEKEAAATRDSELANKARELRELSGQREFGRALRLLEALERHYGDHPDLEQLGTEVRSAHAEEVDTRIASIRQALESNSVDPAAQALASLRRLDPENPALDELAEAVEEKRSVDKRVGDIVDRVNGLIKEGHLDAAFAALKAAEVQHGGGPFVELQQRLQQLRREKLERELAVRIGEGRRHLQKGELPATVAAIEKALAIDPDNQEALAVLKAAQSRLRGPSDTDESVRPEDLGGVMDHATVKLTSQQIRAAEAQVAAEEDLRVRAAEAKRLAEARPKGAKTGELSATTDSDGRKRQPLPSLGESSRESKPTGSPGPTLPPPTEPTVAPASAATSPPVVPPSSAPPARTSSPPRSAPPPPSTLRSTPSTPSTPAAPAAPTPRVPASTPPVAVTSRASEPVGASAPQKPSIGTALGGLPRWVLPAAVGALLLLLIVMVVLWLGGSDRPTSTPVETVANQASAPAPPPAASTTAASDEVAGPDGGTTAPLPAPESEPDALAGEVADPAEQEDSTGQADSPNATPADSADVPTLALVDEPTNTEASTRPRQEILLRDGDGVENTALSIKLDPKAPAPTVGPKFALFYVLVGVDGSVEKVVPLPGGATGEPQFGEALGLVQDAQFEPATLDGEPGRQWATVRVDF